MPAMTITYRYHRFSSQSHRSTYTYWQFRQHTSTFVLARSNVTKPIRMERTTLSMFLAMISPSFLRRHQFLNAEPSLCAGPSRMILYMHYFYHNFWGRRGPGLDPTITSPSNTVLHVNAAAPARRCKIHYWRLCLFLLLENISVFLIIMIDSNVFRTAHVHQLWCSLDPLSLSLVSYHTLTSQRNSMLTMCIHTEHSSERLIIKEICVHTHTITRLNDSTPFLTAVYYAQPHAT